MAKKIEDLEISMERGKQISGDDYKYLILAEFKERQRQQNALVTEAMQTPSKPAAEAAQPSATVVVATGKEQSKHSSIKQALAESKGTDWLLALIAFLLFCILISK